VRTLLLVVVAQAAFGQSSGGDGQPARKFAPDLAPVVARAYQGATADETVKLIVQYKQSPQSEQEGRVQRLGGRLRQRLSMVKGIALTIPASALPALEADPEIESISADHPVKGMDDFTNAAMNVSAALNAGYNGAGIGVAVIDSGINPHSYDWYSYNAVGTKGPLRVVYHADFTGASEYTTLGGLVYDTYGHGTHVAGIIGGNGHLSNGQYAGVAPMVNLIDLRVLDQNGNGSDSQVIAGIQRAIALKSAYNIRVINLSLGRGVFVPYAKDPLCQAVESAWKAGIVVVAAAGNYGRVNADGIDGYGTIVAPGNDPLVLTVGAMKTMDTFTRSDDRIASYSSKGPTLFDHVVKPDLVAPGNTVVSVLSLGSTLYNEYPANWVNAASANQGVGGAQTTRDYFVLSGTSMATPAASGAVALLLQAHPSLTPDQVKARLMKTAYKTFPVSSVATDPTTGETYTSYYDVFTVGAGYLDVAAALGNTDLASSKVGAALSPAASYNSSTGKVTLTNGSSTIDSSSVVWASSAVWGTSVVWGTNVSGSSVVWGTSVVWGSSSATGFSVVWGTSTTTASSVIWGTDVTDGESLALSLAGEY